MGAVRGWARSMSEVGEWRTGASGLASHGARVVQPCTPAPCPTTHSSVHWSHLGLHLLVLLVELKLRERVALGLRAHRWIAHTQPVNGHATGPACRTVLLHARRHVQWDKKRRKARLPKGAEQRPLSFGLLTPASALPLSRPAPTSRPRPPSLLPPGRAAGCGTAVGRLPMTELRLPLLPLPRTRGTGTLFPLCPHLVGPLDAELQRAAACEHRLAHGRSQDDHGVARARRVLRAAAHVEANLPREHTGKATGGGAGEA